MKIFFSLLICLFFTGSLVFSQKKETVITLNDSSVFRGKLIDSFPGKIRVQTPDGQVFVVATDRIVRRELQPVWGSYVYRGKGFAHFTELGPLVAGKTTINGVTTAAFSFQTVNGYKWNRWLYTGLGVGADLYATQTIIPVFASIRGDLGVSGTVLPFYFIDGGYGENITQDAPGSFDFKGGLMYAAGLGLKIPFNKRAGFLMSLGYRYQKSSYQTGVGREEVLYKRLALRAGFFL